MTRAEVVILLGYMSEVWTNAREASVRTVAAALSGDRFEICPYWISKKGSLLAHGGDLRQTAPSLLPLSGLSLTMLGKKAGPAWISAPSLLLFFPLSDKYRKNASTKAKCVNIHYWEAVCRFVRKSQMRQHGSIGDILPPPCADDLLPALGNAFLDKNLFILFPRTDCLTSMNRCGEQRSGFPQIHLFPLPLHSRRRWFCSSSS